MQRRTQAARSGRTALMAGLAVSTVLILGGCAATQEAADETGEEIDEVVDEIEASDTWQAISENWDEFQDSASDYWSELTDDDLEDVDGDRDSLIEEVSETYEISESDAEQQVDDWVDTLD